MRSLVQRVVEQEVYGVADQKFEAIIGPAARRITMPGGVQTTEGDRWRLGRYVVRRLCDEKSVGEQIHHTPVEMPWGRLVEVGMGELVFFT